MPTADSALVILTKAPEPGQSKTRLVPPLTFAEAAELAHVLLTDQLENLASFSAAQLFLAYTPLSAADFFAALIPPGASCFCQRGDSLGERMRHAFENLFARDFQRVILIGGDLPALPVTILDDAIASLETKDCEVVLGPSFDGGYYLVGMNELVPDMFDDIEWSRHDVLARTIEKLQAQNKKYKMTHPWYDIDTIDDLRRLEVDCSPGPAGLMQKTSTLLRKFKRGGKLS
jgi:rSAM/selenodomain-associated transferase 1